MRPAVTLAIGLLVGGAGGFLAGRQTRHVEPSALAGRESDERPPDGTPSATTSPDLAAHPSPPPRALPSAITFDLKDWIVRLTTHPKIVGVGFQPTTSIWDTLAFVYARTEAVTELESVLFAALATGVPTAAVEAQLALIPAREGLAVLRHLRQAFPSLAWSEPTYARMLLLGGEDEEGARIGLAAIGPSGLAVDVVSLLPQAIHRSNRERADDTIRETFERLQALNVPTVQLAGFARGAEAALGVDAAKAMRHEVERRTAADATATAATNHKDNERHRQAALDATIKDPRSFEAWVSLGDMEMNAKNRTAAFEAYRRANEIAPNEMEPIEGMVEINPGEAVGLLERRVAEIPDDDALRLLTLTLLRLDRGREAGEAFFRVSHPDSDDYVDAGLETLAPDAAIKRLKPFIATRGDDRPRLLRILARAYEALGRRGDALSALEASKTDGNEWDYYREIVRIAPETGVTVMTEVAEKDSDNVLESHLLLAQALRLSGRLEAAKASFAIALRHDEGTWSQMRIEAALLDPEDGFASLVEWAKSDGGAYRWLGEAYARAGRFADARAAYDHYLADHRDDVEVLVLRCRCR